MRTKSRSSNGFSKKKKPMTNLKPMTPFQRFLNGLESAQLDMNEMLNELRAFAEVMSRKSNTVEMDENGYFYVTSAGPLEEIIPVMHKQIDKLERIKKQKDSV